MRKKALRLGILICGIVATLSLTSQPALSTSDDSHVLKKSPLHVWQTGSASHGQAYILLAGGGHGGSSMVRDHRSSGSDGGTYTFSQGGGIKHSPIVSNGDGEGGVSITPNGNQGSTYGSGGPNGGGPTVRDHRHQ
jgi:hypothetical protein